MPERNPTFRIRLAPMALLAALSGTASAAWLEARNDDFVLVTDASEDRARAILRDFEVFKLSLDKLAPLSRSVPVVPTSMFAIDAQDWQGFSRNPGMLGFFSETPGRNYILLDRTPGPVDVREVLFHEYMHYLQHNGSRVALPLWWDEGVAELFCTISEKRNQIEFGRYPKMRGRDLAIETMLPLERMLVIDRDSPEWHNSYSVSVFYAQAWLMAHYFVVGRPERAKQVSVYLRAVDDGMSVDQAVQKAFGVDVQALEQEILAYRKANRIPMFRFDVGALPDGHDTVVRVLPESVANARLALAARSLRKPLASSRRFLDRATSADAQHPLVIAAKATQLAAEGRGQEVRVAVQQVLSAPGVDSEARHAAAMALMAQVVLEVAGVSFVLPAREDADGSENPHDDPGEESSMSSAILMDPSRLAEPNAEQRERLREARSTLAALAPERDYRLGATLNVAALDALLGAESAETLAVLEKAAIAYPTNPELAGFEAWFLLRAERRAEALSAISRGAEHARNSTQRRFFMDWMRALE